MQKIKIIILGGVITCFLAACNNDTFTPKPKGYNRIDLPAHTYKPLQEDHPFTFEISTHSKATPHVSWLSEPHWIDLKYPELNATVELTYKDLKKEKDGVDGLLKDAHKLANKHNVKAYAIEESLIKTPKGYTAAIFELEGEVPSQFQFFITDSTSHFLRGALYFPISTKNDSLRPAIDFIKKDMIHLLNTLEWKN